MIPSITAIADFILKRLPSKNLYDTVHCLGLIVLYGKLEFHLFHQSTFLTVCGL